jgi:hypothetical protein
MVTSSCTRITKGDGTHENTWPVLESLWLHPPALESEADGSHESTWPALKGLWLHPPVLEL